MTIQSHQRYMDGWARGASGKSPKAASNEPAYVHYVRGYQDGLRTRSDADALELARQGIDDAADAVMEESPTPAIVPAMPVAIADDAMLSGFTEIRERALRASRDTTERFQRIDTARVEAQLRGDVLTFRAPKEDTLPQRSIDAAPPFNGAPSYAGFPGVEED